MEGPAHLAREDIVPFIIVKLKLKPYFRIFCPDTDDANSDEFTDQFIKGFGALYTKSSAN